jgi:type II secretory pathway pseudopilin PulG
MKHSKKNQGFSLVEILLVIGIIIALAIAAFILYPRVQSSQQANAESQNITAILAQTKQVFSNGTYDDLTNDVANAARIFPSSMNGNVNAAGTAIKNVWGGVVTIADPSTAAGDRLFTLKYVGVPSEPCARLVTGVGSNVERVYVKGESTAGTDGAPSTAAGSTDEVKAANSPVQQALTATKCGANASATVVFVSN